MKTDEWKSRMTEYDTRLDRRLNVKDEELTQKITDTNYWNRISLDDFDKLFDYEMNKTIDDKLLIHIEDVKLNTKSDNNYLNMEIGLP